MYFGLFRKQEEVDWYFHQHKIPKENNHFPKLTFNLVLTLINVKANAFGFILSFNCSQVCLTN
jgi:hypothetical protein